jgi:hypothetical protein
MPQQKHRQLWSNVQAALCGPQLQCTPVLYSPHTPPLLLRAAAALPLILRALPQVAPIDHSGTGYLRWSQPCGRPQAVSGRMLHAACCAVQAYVACCIGCHSYAVGPSAITGRPAAHIPCTAAQRHCPLGECRTDEWLRVRRIGYMYVSYLRIRTRRQAYMAHSQRYCFALLH